MKIIQEQIEGPMFQSRILETYLDSRRTVVADIETTGLSPRSAKVILGGLVAPDGEHRLALQYFADHPEVEEELLDRYGPIPEQVRGLLDAALIRGCGGEAGIEKIRVAPGRTVIEGPLRSDMFLPPRWLKENNTRVGIGGVQGLAAVVNELKRKLSPGE